MSNASEGESVTPPNPLEPASGGLLVAAAAAGLAVIAVAGFVSAIAVGQFGEPGLLLVWLGGFLGGSIAKQLLRGGTSKAVGGVLAAGCGIAVIYVEVHYIRFHLVGGEDGWLASFQLLPTFVKQFKFSALVGVLVAVFGGLSAYRQVAFRYRYVRVEA